MVRHTLTLFTILLAALLVLPPLEAQQGRFVPGTGEYEVVTGADPAAGAEISVTVPAGFSWRLTAVSATLVTDATAATRRVGLLLDDGATQLWAAQATDGQAASLTRGYSWPNLGSYVVAQTTTIGIPGPDGFFLRSGSRVRTATVNFQAGDNWGVPVFYVERFRN
jgi:hypothetical protein